MKTYKLPVSKETCDYLQRLSFEIETRKSVVTRLLENAKDQTNTDVLESPAFKKYHKMLEEANVSYEIAKGELSSQLEKVVYEKEGKEVPFDWNIFDFSKYEATITVRE